MILDEIIPDLSAITVEVINPETPFGGVQIIGASDAPIQVVFGTGAGETEAPDTPPSGGAEVPVTANLLSGDLAGGLSDSGILPSSVVQKNTAYPTPTTLNTVIACLKANGLCAP